MANFIPSEITISYDETVFGNVGDDILDYIDPRKSRFVITGNGEDTHDTNRIRITDPQLDDANILTDKFEKPGTYKQLIYVVVNGIKNLFPDRIHVNNRQALPAEVIMLEQDIIVLQRDLKIVEPEEHLEVKQQAKDASEFGSDVTVSELGEKTNSVWKNEAIKPQTIYVRADHVAHIYDAYGAVNEQDNFERLLEFEARIKRINTLENREFYKVYDNTYILVSDTVDEQTAEKQREMMLNEAQEAREHDMNLAQQASNVDLNIEDATDAATTVEEEVTPFKVIANPDVIPMFFDAQGASVPDRRPQPGSILDVTAVLHNKVIGADYYKVAENLYILKADTVEYNSTSLKETQEKMAGLANDDSFDFSMNELKEPADSQAINMPVADQEPVEHPAVASNVQEPTIGETAQIDAHAARNAFEQPDNQEETKTEDDNVEVINGIVQIKGQEDLEVNLFDSYKDKRNILTSKVNGQSFWYTMKKGADSNGNEFYEIARNQWVSAEDVNYFENN